MKNNFRFSCHSGLECFNGCCKEADIFLTPYDVLRMKNRLGIDSREFLEKYTGIIMDETGPPIMFLEMSSGEDKKTCHFVGDSGCEIYEDRPGQCRAFPIKPVGAGNYVISDDEKCLGFQEGREWSLEEWKKDQGVDVYNEIDDLFKEISLNQKLIKKNLQDSNILQMFFMAYDMDTFRRFVFESKFLDVFDIDEAEVKRIKEDELELLKFSFKWLKFGLIDKDALKIKEGAAPSDGAIS